MTRMIGRMAVQAAVTALMAATATAAMAQTGTAPNYGCPTGEVSPTVCINGGGSSLAAYVYSAPASGSFPGGELTQYAASTGGSIGFSYEKASSGAGQTAFLNNDPGDFNGTTESGYPVDFAASDAFVNSGSVLFPYVGAGHPIPAGGGQFIQIPIFATPITVPITNTKMTANGKVSLTDSDLCGIFSGKLTNWNQTSVASKLTAGTIKVYWRDDNSGSGTTFLFTNHLASVCTAAETLSGFTFSATTKFATLFNGVHGVTVVTPPNDGATVWTIPVAADGSFANLVGAKGSSGVADGVNNDATGSATGYLSPDYTAIAAIPATTTAPKPYTKLFVASVPTLANVSLAINNPGSDALNPQPPTTAAASAIQTNWVPVIFTPSKGYPITGYTNWDFAQCYKTAAVANGIAGFLKKHYSGAYATAVSDSGFVPLVGGAASGYGSAINKNFLTNGSGFNQNLQNATACKSVVKR
jgi:ABC-type phosphate transport system substrate-binding protein